MNNVLDRLKGLFGVGGNQKLLSPVTTPNNMQAAPYNFPTGNDSGLESYYAREGRPAPDYQAPVTRQAQTTPTPMQQYVSPSASTSIPGFTTGQIPPDYQKLILQASQQSGIHPAVLASLLFTEHGFSRTPGINRNTNGSYDRGPAQINSQAHPEITDTQAYDPSFAIPWAANLLKNYINQTGSLKQGIAAYNVGPGGATVYGKGSGKLGTKGQRYLSAVEQGITPDVIKQLGL